MDAVDAVAVAAAACAATSLLANKIAALLSVGSRLFGCLSSPARWRCIFAWTGKLYAAAIGLPGSFNVSIRSHFG